MKGKTKPHRKPFVTPPRPEPLWRDAPIYGAKRSFPAYAFTRGLPHPNRDPEGHSFGLSARVVPLDPARWQECPDYRYAVDLYHAGYFWEAHEAWEGLWHVAGRDTTAHGRLLRGLIRLAAAFLKLRAGVARGALLHSQASHALLGEALAMRGAGDGPFLGLDIAALRSAMAHHFAPLWASDGVRLDTRGVPPRLLLAL